VANKFGTDILIQAEDPKAAAAWYVEQLGFEISVEATDMISLHGKHINMFIERGPALGPVLEVTVDNLDEATKRLVRSGEGRTAFSPPLCKRSLRVDLQLNQVSNGESLRRRTHYSLKTLTFTLEWFSLAATSMVRSPRWSINSSKFSGLI
jgi:hypothetical protein